MRIVAYFGFFIELRGNFGQSFLLFCSTCCDLWLDFSWISVILLWTIMLFGCRYYSSYLPRNLYKLWNFSSTICFVRQRMQYLSSKKAYKLLEILIVNLMHLSVIALDQKPVWTLIYLVKRTQKMSILYNITFNNGINWSQLGSHDIGIKLSKLGSHDIGIKLSQLGSHDIGINLSPARIHRDRSIPARIHWINLSQLGSKDRYVDMGISKNCPQL